MSVPAINQSDHCPPRTECLYPQSINQALAHLGLNVCTKYQQSFNQTLAHLERLSVPTINQIPTINQSDPRPPRADCLYQQSINQSDPHPPWADCLTTINQSINQTLAHLGLTVCNNNQSIRPLPTLNNCLFQQSIKFRQSINQTHAHLGLTVCQYKQTINQSDPHPPRADCLYRQSMNQPAK